MGAALSCPFKPKAVLFCGAGNFGGWLGGLIAEDSATIADEKTRAAATLRRI
jgi:hypothetical protein